MKILENYSLKAHNTFGLDLKTRWFVEYENEADLQKLLQDEYFFSLQIFHIGEGSNVLILDDFGGVVVHSQIKGIEILKETEETVQVKVGAAEVWDDFVAYSVEKGWGNIENLSLIPGEVGASAFQNIGAYGVEVCDSIIEVHAYNVESGEKQIFSRADCQFAYRHSIFKEPDCRGKYFITHVVYNLSKQPQFNIEYGNLKELLTNKELNLKNVRDAVIAVRESKLPDPKVLGNAGSFFVNPYICKAHFEALKTKYVDMPFYSVNEEVVKVPAAWLIDQCGLKGKTIGGAAIHEKQPLVIVNKGNATATDIAELADFVCKEVKDKFSIELEKEVYYL